MIEKIELSSDNYTAQINLLGAELISFLSLNKGREYIWQRDETWWKRSAPILFPFIGVLKDSSYKYKDQNYKMTKHGFARDCKFNVLNKDKSSAILELIQNEHTKSMYPFKYELNVIFTLNENTLNVRYEVKNNDEKELPFSIGSHPAFNLFLKDEEIKHEDYSITFEEAENSYSLLENDLVNLEKSYTTNIKGDSVILTKNTFDNDALIFSNVKSTNVVLECKKINHKVKMAFDKTSFFGVWSPKEAPFVCLEPWSGIPDTINHNGELENKSGVILLKPCEKFSTGYTLTAIS